MKKILVINPGSTSTKVAVFHDLNPWLELNIAHTPEELSNYNTLEEQLPFRQQIITDKLREHSIPFDFDAVIGRGGLAKPIEGGVYRVSWKMIEDSINAKHKHACDLGCMIAHDIATMIPGCQSFIADPGVVDELCDEARVSGMPSMKRICIWHALNQRAIARRYAEEHNTTYEALNLIMCHLGGGISVAAHCHGRAIDANNALDGEGPFSPSRAGSLPITDVIHMCFNSGKTEEELNTIISSKAGITAYLGTNDMQKVEKMIQAGNEEALALVRAMTYHTAKWIAAEGAVLEGKVDAIILTGGIAYSKRIVDLLRKRIEWIAPVVIYPGEDEMKALAQNAYDVLTGKVEPKEY